jgi:DNA (cytosine-5)-methyltransferase 1
MRHLDLFSGIGGFALAADWVWGDVEHIFCEIDPFCQKVLKKHWPDAPINTDIRTLNNEWITANANTDGFSEQEFGNTKESSFLRNSRNNTNIDLLTGGFPCQPFSCAGKRDGKSDDRYLWPEMLRVIRETRPRWIIGENVAGIVSMAQSESESGVESEADNKGDCGGEGLSDGILCGIIDGIEKEGYAVQTFIIPACAVNAPHRRDRVWIVAHAIDCNNRGWRGQIGEADGVSELDRQTVCARMSCGTDEDAAYPRQQYGESWNSERVDENENIGTACTTNTERQSKAFRNSESTRLQSGIDGQGERQHGGASSGCIEWDRDWLEVATELCGMDDGLPAELDGFKLSKSKHREQRLKSLGNAIVPQVAAVIMQAIKEID